MLRLLKFLFRPALALFVLLIGSAESKAYSLLAHEAIIDASWQITTVPILKQKYPGLTADQIKLAHSYAYGGALVADMGYMPFGNAFFTDLLHYVRSGDFVENLLKNAKDVNEYAFAMGAMSHYMADKYGHSMATNRNIPLIYPKLQQKFGDVVTYNEDHTSHSRMEFSYDVLQTARGTYTSEGYHDFIGFNIAVPVLEKAFYQTYGRELSSIFSNIDRAINNLRWGVRNLFPLLTRSAFKSHQEEIQKLHPGVTAKQFRYKMSRRSFRLEYGKNRDEPKFFARVAVFLIRILPKVGPLKTLKFVSPGTQGEKLFAVSFDSIVNNYSRAQQQAAINKLELEDIDFDTGQPTVIGEYPLADKTFDELLVKLKEDNFVHVSPDLKDKILSFYKEADVSARTTQKEKEWQKVATALTQLKSYAPVISDNALPKETAKPVSTD